MELGSRLGAAGAPHMSWDKRQVLGLLRLEIENIRRRGTGAYFRDSVVCLNAGKSIPTDPCTNCVLLNLVPPEARHQPLPCSYIPLDDAGQTLQILARNASREQCQKAILAWMERTADRLEKELAEERIQAS